MPPTCVVPVLDLVAVTVQHEPVIPDQALVAPGDADAVTRDIIKREACKHTQCIECSTEAVFLWSLHRQHADCCMDQTGCMLEKYIWHT